MPYNKGVLDSYRQIITKDIITRTLEVTGSVAVGGITTIGGNLYVTGSISGSSWTGPATAITTHASTHFSGSTDAISIDPTQVSGSGTFSDINLYASSLLTSIRTHTPSAHASGHAIGGGDTVTITTAQISNISGSLYITGAAGISGSQYDGPVLLVRTGSTTGYYSGSKLDFVDMGGAMWSLATGSGNEIQVRLQASGSGGTGPSLSDGVTVETAFGQSSTAGVGITASRGDHTHGTPTLSDINSSDIADTATSGSINSGSRVDHVHRGVTSVQYSGSSALYGAITITGSTNLSGSQNGQAITLALGNSLSGIIDITATNVTGSTLVSGSTIQGKTATITSINATNITGSTISGSTGTFKNIIATTITGSSIISGATIYSPDAFISNVHATEISGSTISGSTGYIDSLTTTSFNPANINCTNLTGSANVSGSNIIGATATITYLTATSVTGSTLVSGSTIQGKDAIITNITATNVTGSTLVSGSTIQGKSAVITNITATRITGSNISGSTVIADTLSAASFAPTTINAVYVTGSSIVSGGTVYVGTVLSGSKLIIVGNISGSNFSGSIPIPATANTGTYYTRHKLNFIQGTNVSILAADDSSNDKIDITFTANTGSGELSAVYTIYSSSGLYYAQNGHTGVVTSNSDAGTLINQCIQAMSSNESGKLHFKNGTYYLYTGSTATSNAVVIVYKNNLIIEGEGWGTIFRLGNGIYNGFDTTTGSSTSPLTGIVFSDFQIDGESTATYSTDTQLKNGIRCRYYTQNVTFRNLWIHHIANTGIYNTQYANKNLITGCKLTNCYRYGLSYTSSDRGRIIGNYFSGSWIGLNWDASFGPVDYTIIDSNIFDHNGNSATSGTHDIHAYGEEGAETKNGVISNNVFFSDPGSSQIKMNKCWNVILKGNLFINSNTTANLRENVQLYYCANCTIEGNYFESTNWSQITMIADNDCNISNNTFNQRNARIIDAQGSNANILVSGNKFIDGQLVTLSGDIRFSIVGNDFTPSGSLSDASTSPIIKYNSGWVTENNGTLILTSTSGSVAHGLSSTPKYVYITSSGSSANLYRGSLTWYPVGSTLIWIVQTGSGTVAVNWKAEA